MICHPKLYRHLFDDHVGPVAEWVPVDHELVSYVGVRDGEELIGVIIVGMHSLEMWECHEAFLPSAWGRKARRAAREFAEWVWKNKSVQRVIGHIAANPVALAYAKAAGMEECGRHPKAFMKNGKLEDIIIVGANRPEGI